MTKDASSDANQHIASTTSLAVPKRPIGCIAIAIFLFSVVSKARSAMGVSITAGQTELTRMLFLAYSNAVALVIPTTPNFAA